MGSLFQLQPKGSSTSTIFQQAEYSFTPPTRAIHPVTTTESVDVRYPAAAATALLFARSIGWFFSQLMQEADNSTM
jgi:hypothetical protein